MTTETHDLALCDQILKRKSKSFRLASRLLAPEVRRATVVLYAYCRRCDDAVDEGNQEPEHRRAAVLLLRSELDAVYAGLPQTDPVLAAFQAVVMHYQIPRLYPEELVTGMSMDAQGTRYESLEDLLLYCHRVAGTVGLMMCHVLGVRDARALRNAAHLGIAMQLTNICRDVLEDFRLGRIYLPALLLRTFGGTTLLGRTSERALYEPATRRAIALVVHALLSEASGYYRSGDRGLWALPFRSALAVRTARMLYAAIGTRLYLSGADPLRGRAVTPGSWKIVLVARALIASLFSAPARLFAACASRSHAVVLREVRFPDDVLPL